MSLYIVYSELFDTICFFSHFYRSFFFVENLYSERPEILFFILWLQIIKFWANYFFNNNILFIITKLPLSLLCLTFIFRTSGIS